MKRQNLSDGTWFDRSKAAKFDEETWWNGNNHVSVNTGDQYVHERLYRTAKGAWVLRRWSQWQGTAESWERIEEEDAFAWLLKNEHEDKVPPEFLAQREV